jgi:hypothetical protein
VLANPFIRYVWTMPFTEHEQEAIILNAAWSMIDDMVNFSVFMPLNGAIENINLIPRTSDTLRLFHVLLGDFLSPLVRKGRGGLPFDLPALPTKARSSDLTFLFYLRHVCECPRLNASAEVIRGPVESFAAWLESPSYVEDVWLPSIGVQASLTMPRITWLKICADIGKHNFARLEPNVAKIVRILADHGKQIDEGMGYAVLPEFWEWFHTHLFAYHASTIAEFLNNIRWGIHEYLRTEFGRAYHTVEHGVGPVSYAFDVPREIRAPIAHSMYWELMNMARGKPFFPPFTVTPALKGRY